VEADEAERTALMHLLGHLPMPVSSFGSAEELLDVIDTTDCRVLISELKLPGKSGLELLAEMNARGRLVPTILLSEDCDVGTAVNAMRAGAVDFIEKPVIDRILLRRVKDAIGRLPSP
jgi:FixJ family two-component response regulator